MAKHIEREQVQDLVERGAQLVEVLPASEYEAAHLPQAINIPLRKLDAAAAARLNRDQPVIVYCNDYQ